MTIEEALEQLLLEVGAGLEGLPDEILAAVLDKITHRIDVIWEAWRWKAYYPGLQYLYAKWQCLGIIAGQNRDRMQISVGGATLPQGAIFDNVMKMREEVKKEIERVEEIALASRRPAMGMMASAYHMDAYGRLYNPLGWPVPQGNRWY